MTFLCDYAIIMLCKFGEKAKILSVFGDVSRRNPGFLREIMGPVRSFAPPFVSSAMFSGGSEPSESGAGRCDCVFCSLPFYNNCRRRCAGGMNDTPKRVGQSFSVGQGRMADPKTSRRKVL